ncbi:response regulator [Desulfonatronum thioautotrophicum]|uniref:response regulator n=1 Tax=Desulfonatronum thioautotrophicum TaxID=617001 RepID=UPI0005EB592C|nr:response regulator [Desulfonatronum thioautotrophicum]
MKSMNDFRKMDFLCQIALLTEARAGGDPGVIPGLVELFTQPVDDPVIDSMVRTTLREVLLRNPPAILDFLNHETTKLRRFCALLAGEAKLVEAVAPLMQFAREWQNDPDAQHDALTALARLGDPAALPLFREHLDHHDDYIACVCISQIGAHGDAASQARLEGFIDANEAPDQVEQCSVLAWSAIEALQELNTQEALAFLASKIHHQNPTARRLVQKGLVAAGERAVPLLAAILEQSEDTDEKILASNALGLTGGRQAANVLINALERQVLRSPNERFSGYEALGRIAGMKSVVFLQDAMWKETDPLLLLAIVKGLEALFQPTLADGLAQEMSARLKQSPDSLGRALRAIIAAQAGALFATFFSKPELGPRVLEELEATANRATLETLSQALESRGFAGEARTLRTLGATNEAGSTDADLPRMLAVDDSEAMRAFYVQFGMETGWRVHTAENGQAALDALEAGGTFDILVTDMNMPVMDGTEMTRKMRARPEWADMPIVMASTESSKAQARIAKNVGVNSFIVKPFTSAQLREKISRYLSGPVKGSSCGVSGSPGERTKK